uniref:DUF1725 domain-containing protein n=1 Tax=Myotis myotis TaxID=51298 RepID=A0A7J7SCG0_MYOMY|nr:hypothetical protein mMyoMyo1_009474 [Myotis myotis]
MFIAALFTLVKIWKQPKCPLADEWIKKVCYIYTMEYYAGIKKKELLPFATAWMDLESIMLSKISQLRKIHITCSHSFVEYNEQHKLMNKNRSRDIEPSNRLSNLREKAGEGGEGKRSTKGLLCIHMNMTNKHRQ